MVYWCTHVLFGYQCKLSWHRQAHISIYSAKHREIIVHRGFPVRSIFDPKDLDNFGIFPSHECPMCKAGQKLDALINCHGFSKI